MRVTVWIAGLAFMAGVALAHSARANPFPEPDFADGRDLAILVIVTGTLVGGVLIRIAYLRQRHRKRAYLRERYEERHRTPPGS